MKKRVLIVEDNKVFAALLRDNLEYEGFAVEIYEGFAVEISEASVESLLKHFPPDFESLDSILGPGVDEPGDSPIDRPATNLHADHRVIRWWAGEKRSDQQPVCRRRR